MSIAERLRTGISTPSRPREVAVRHDRFRAALDTCRAGTAVVVTVLDPEGRPLAVTVSGVSEVSLRPPLVVTCLHEDSAALAVLLSRRAFAIDVVDEDRRVLATLRCALHDVADGGDHSVVVGHVTEVSL